MVCRGRAFVGLKSIALASRALVLDTCSTSDRCYLKSDFYFDAHFPNSCVDHHFSVMQVGSHIGSLFSSVKCLLKLNSSYCKFSYFSVNTPSGDLTNLRHHQRKYMNLRYEVPGFMAHTHCHIVKRADKPSFRNEGRCWCRWQAKLSSAQV